MTKENKFKIGLCLQGIALSMDEITLKANEDRLKMIEEIIIAEPTGDKQEPCENCDYSEIMDWEQDAKTGKAKPIYWCERHKELCDDVVSRQAVINSFKNWLNDNKDPRSFEEVVKEMPSAISSQKEGDS